MQITTKCAIIPVGLEKSSHISFCFCNTHRFFSMKKLEIILCIFTDLFAEIWPRYDVCLLSAFLIDEECVAPTYRCTMDTNSTLTDSVFLSSPNMKLKYVILLVASVDFERKKKERFMIVALT